MKRQKLAHEGIFYFLSKFKKINKMNEHWTKKVNKN